MASKLCDSCKSASATIFCRADSAFLCIPCDSSIHAANKLASRHPRVWLCQVCEQAPAHVTCKADAAALCVACDQDIHSANPLARRHERVPITPFYDAVSDIKQPNEDGVVNFLDINECDADAVSREEAEAESWLLPNPKVGGSDPDMNSGQYVFSDVDPYLDLEFGHVDSQEHESSGADCVVPVQKKSESVHHHAPDGGIVNDHCFDLEFSKPFTYAYSNNPQSLSHSVSSSSMEVGVVPDGSNTTDVTNPFSKPITNGLFNSSYVAPVSSVDREAKVMRYREKRKNRKFEKTIRYASRKAYAETRPRIKGRFAKRTDLEADADRVYGYGIVPSF